MSRDRRSHSRAMRDNMSNSSTVQGGGNQASIAYHHSANSPNATRQSLAISCCGCGSRDIFSDIALGYTAPRKKTAATKSGMSCLRFMLMVYSTSAEAPGRREAAGRHRTRLLCNARCSYYDGYFRRGERHGKYLDC